jgi:hypothetical protein
MSPCTASSASRWRSKPLSGRPLTTIVGTQNGCCSGLHAGGRSPRRTDPGGSRASGATRATWCAPQLQLRFQAGSDTSSCSVKCDGDCHVTCTRAALGAPSPAVSRVAVDGLLGYRDRSTCTNNAQRDPSADGRESREFISTTIGHWPERRPREPCTGYSRDHEIHHADDGVWREAVRLLERQPHIAEPQQRHRRGSCARVCGPTVLIHSDASFPA